MILEAITEVLKTALLFIILGILLYCSVLVQYYFVQNYRKKHGLNKQPFKRWLVSYTEKYSWKVIMIYLGQRKGRRCCDNIFVPFLFVSKTIRTGYCYIKLNVLDKCLVRVFRYIIITKGPVRSYIFQIITHRTFYVYICIYKI